MDRKVKEKKYQQISKEIFSVLDGIHDEIAMMSTINCLLHQGMDYFFWTGFYRVYKPGELIVGPYQGTLGCLTISFGKGVCGTCAKRRETVIVPDVHQFPGHIACDSRSNSEIVVPVFNGNKELIAVFDVDSTEFNAFDDMDQLYLEKIMRIFERI